MLSGKQLVAAAEVARDKRSLAKIARKLKVGERTLSTWKAAPEFQVEVERLLNLWAEGVEKKGIADRRRRLFRLNDRWRRAQSFIEQRAKLFKQLAADDEQLRNVPGGNTGMVAWDYKMLHVGEQSYERLIEYKWDAGLSADLRATEEQAGIELGQWKPKHEISFAEGGGALRIQYLSSLTDDELQLLIAIARKLEAAGPVGGAEPAQPEPDGKTLPGDGAAPQGALPQTS